MSHFSLKSLTFYGVAISSVLLLFRGVTAYGNANLKAPLPIDGIYRIEAQNLPECFKTKTLMLNIQQSGIYLFGSVTHANMSEQQKKATEETLSLVGQLKNQHLSLSGPVQWLVSCNHSGTAETAKSSSLVKTEGKFDGETLTGQITLGSPPGTAEFSAEREVPVQQSEGH